MIDDTGAVDVCFLPSNETCPTSYIRSVTTGIRYMRTVKATLVLIIYLICLLNNGTSIYVFSRRQFRGKLVTNLIRTLYIGNIVYVTIFAAYICLFYTYPFEVGYLFASISCRVLWFGMRVGVSFANWMLAIIALIRMNMTVFPTKFMVFRGNPSNSWILLGGCLVVCSLVNLPSGLLMPALDYCQFGGRTVCVIYNFDLLYFVFGFYTSLFICVVSSAIIYYKSLEMTMTTTQANVYTPLNQMVLSSSLLFALSSIPLCAYYTYYLTESDVHCGEKFELRLILHPLVVFMLLCNNSLDSTIYFIVSPSYKTIALLFYSHLWAHLTRKGPRWLSHRGTYFVEDGHTTENFSREKSMGQDDSEFQNESTVESRGSMCHVDPPKYVSDRPRSTLEHMQIWFTAATMQLVRVRKGEDSHNPTLVKKKSVSKTDIGTVVASVANVDIFPEPPQPDINQQKKLLIQKHMQQNLLIKQLIEQNKHATSRKTPSIGVHSSGRGKNSNSSKGSGNSDQAAVD